MERVLAEAATSQSSVLQAEAFAVCTIGFVLAVQWLTSKVEKALATHKHAEDMLR